jgi:hypothetical protein
MADATDIKLKAFDSVSEWSKQIITIASATLVLSATFIKDILAGAVVHQGSLTAAWVLLLSCIASGVFVLSALSASLNKGDPAELDIYSPAIVITALLQIGLFVAGMSFFIYFAAANFPIATKPPQRVQTTANFDAGNLDDAFFDLNSSAIRDDASLSLSQDSEKLKSAFHDLPKARAVIEGYCDDRGSTGYNLLLGYRRAAAVKNFLAARGVSAEKLRVASFGRDSSVCNELTDACRQKNRRVHLAPE